MDYPQYSKIPKPWNNAKPIQTSHFRKHFGGNHGHWSLGGRGGKFEFWLRFAVVAVVFFSGTKWTKDAWEGHEVCGERNFQRRHEVMSCFFWETGVGFSLWKHEKTFFYIESWWRFLSHARACRVALGCSCKTISNFPPGSCHLRRCPVSLVAMAPQEIETIAENENGSAFEVGAPGWCWGRDNNGKTRRWK